MLIASEVCSVLDSSKGKVLRARDIMVAARDLGKKANVDGHQGWVNILGAMDVRLVTFVHNKTAGRKIYAPLEAIACTFFFDELCAEFPTVSEFPCPWVAVPLAATAAATATPSKDQMNIRELDADGTLNKTTLVELGIVVGARAQPKIATQDASSSAAASASAPEAASASAPKEVVAIEGGFVVLKDKSKISFKNAAEIGNSSRPTLRLSWCPSQLVAQVNTSLIWQGRRANLRCKVFTTCMRARMRRYRSRSLRSRAFSAWKNCSRKL